MFPHRDTRRAAGRFWRREPGLNQRTSSDYERRFPRSFGSEKALVSAFDPYLDLVGGAEARE